MVLDLVNSSLTNSSGESLGGGGASDWLIACFFYRILGAIKSFASFGLNKTGLLFYFIFDLLVVVPLHAFYFDAWQGGMPSHELCARITGATTTDHWRNGAANIEDCKELLDRKFRSFEVAILMSIYVTFFFIFLIRIACCCLFYKPSFNKQRISTPPPRQFPRNYVCVQPSPATTQMILQEDISPLALSNHIHKTYAAQLRLSQSSEEEKATVSVESEK